MKTTRARLIGAWLRGTFDRLDNARARREAAFGRPDRALVMAFGERTSSHIVFDAVHRYPGAFERLAYYQRLIRRHIAPGGVRLWPDEDPFV